MSVEFNEDRVTRRHVGKISRTMMIEVDLLTVTVCIVAGIEGWFVHQLWYEVFWGEGGGREGCPELSSVGQFCWASFQFNDGRCSVYEQCQKHIILVDNVLCSSNSTFRGTVS